MNSRVWRCRPRRSEPIHVSLLAGSGPPLVVARLPTVAAADRLAVRLADGSPRASVDLRFGGFGPPVWVRDALPAGRGLHRQRFPDNDPVFEFYSVWIAAVYRHLAGMTGERGETGAA